MKPAERTRLIIASIRARHRAARLRDHIGGVNKMVVAKQLTNSNREG